MKGSYHLVSIIAKAYGKDSPEYNEAKAACQYLISHGYKGYRMQKTKRKYHTKQESMDI